MAAILRALKGKGRGAGGWKLGLLSVGGIAVAGAAATAGPSQARCDNGGGERGVAWKTAGAGLAAAVASAAAWSALQTRPAATDTESWVKKWEIGQTHFHMSTLHPALQNFLRRLLDDGITAPHFPKRILFPLCGKAVDMPFLALAGHRVVGLDCSRMALEQLVKETEGAAIRSESTVGPLQVMESPYPPGCRAGGWDHLAIPRACPS